MTDMAIAHYLSYLNLLYVHTKGYKLLIQNKGQTEDVIIFRSIIFIMIQSYEGRG